MILQVQIIVTLSPVAVERVRWWMRHELGLTHDYFMYADVAKVIVDELHAGVISNGWTPAAIDSAYRPITPQEAR